MSRSLDYLETRNDIDNTKVAYFGFSIGGAIAPVLLAVETRFKAEILSTTGFYSRVLLAKSTDSTLRRA